jgi:transposase
MWERSFLQSGIDALMPATKVRPTDMPDPKPTPSPNEAAGDADDETRPREELLKELKHLRMEVAVLKKLKALVQAEQQAAARRKRK